MLIDVVVGDTLAILHDPVPVLSFDSDWVALPKPISIPVAVSLSGDGTMSATAKQQFARSAGLSGTGGLSATAVEKPWTPLAIPGLAAWIDPQQDLALGRFTDGQAISSYTSYDPGGRVFTGPNPPVFRASSAGGKPRIEFSVARTDFMYTDGYNPGTTGMTFVMVTQTAAPSQYGMMLTWGQPATGMEMRHEAFSFKLQCIQNYSGGGPVASSAFAGSASTDYVNLLRLDRPGNTFKLWINDTLQFSLNTAALPDVADRLRIGHRGDGYYYNGLIAEAMVISGPISDADRAKLMVYLRGKHGALPAVS